MSEHTEVQIIRQGGRPAFAVVPYDQWLALTGKKRDEDVYLPHEVVGLQLKGNSLIAAWRKYRGLSQKTLGEMLGVTQAAVAQMEKGGANLQDKTLARMAEALGATVDQLMD